MLETLAFWIVDRVQEWGYAGIFVMMFVESSFVPFPSELAMIPAGYLASRGDMDPLAATFVGTAGSLGGAFLNYFLALRLGLPALERIGRYVLLREHHFEAAERYFESHGEITTFIARLIPGVRQLISVPAGVARMRLGRFALYTALGAGLWSAILVAIGFWAGAHEELWRPVLRDATGWVLLAATVLVAIYVWAHQRRGRVQ